MAAPTFVAAGTTKSDTLPLATVNWPAGHQSGDLGVLVIQTSAEAPGNNPPAGWTEVAASPKSIGTGATAGSVRLSVFTKYAASSSEPSVDIGDSGDHQIAVILVYRGVDPTTPFNATSGGTAASGTAVSVPTLTTTVADCLVLILIANAVDSATAPLTTGITNANLASITNRKTPQSAVGTGGGVWVGDGGRAVAGAIGATTATLSVASQQALMHLALQPPQGGTSPFGGMYVAMGGKPVAGATGASTGTLSAAQVQAAVTIALKPPTPVVNNAPVLGFVPDLFVNVDDDLAFTFVSTDDAGDVPFYSIAPGSTPVPDGLVVDPASGILTWSPLAVHKGVWNLVVTVTDSGGLQDSQAFNITVVGTGPQTFGAYSSGLTALT